MRLKPEADDGMLEWLSSRAADPSVFGLVAMADSEAAGFLFGRIGEWESVPPVIERRRLGIIDAVYVDDRFRLQGIGGRLIEHALQIMRDRHVTAVETVFDDHDEAAAAMWRRAGFQPWMVHAYRIL